MGCASSKEAAADKPVVATRAAPASAAQPALGAVAPAVAVATVGASTAAPASAAAAGAGAAPAGDEPTLGAVSPAAVAAAAAPAGASPAAAAAPAAVGASPGGAGEPSTRRGGDATAVASSSPSGLAHVVVPATPHPDAKLYAFTDSAAATPVRSPAAQQPRTPGTPRPSPPQGGSGAAFATTPGSGSVGGSSRRPVNYGGTPTGVGGGGGGPTSPPSPEAAALYALVEKAVSYDINFHETRSAGSYKAASEAAASLYGPASLVPAFCDLKRAFALGLMALLPDVDAERATALFDESWEVTRSVRATVIAPRATSGTLLPGCCTPDEVAFHAAETASRNAQLHKPALPAKQAASAAAAVGYATSLLAAHLTLSRLYADLPLLEETVRADAEAYVLSTIDSMLPASVLCVRRLGAESNFIAVVNHILATKPADALSGALRARLADPQFAAMMEARGLAGRKGGAASVPSSPAAAAPNGAAL